MDRYPLENTEIKMEVMKQQCLETEKIIGSFTLKYPPKGVDIIIFQF